MGLYFKIAVLSIFFGLATTVVIHSQDIGLSSSVVCTYVPVSKYEHAIKQYDYGCRTLGFPVRDYEEDVWGHNPHFYPLKTLLNLFLLSLMFFVLFIIFRGILKKLFEEFFAINKITKIATITGLLVVIPIFLLELGSLRIREGTDGFEDVFDVYLYSWWPSFSHWTFLIFPIPIITLLSILLYIGGLINERRLVRKNILVIAEDSKSKIFRKIILHFPLLLSIAWIVIVVVVVGVMGSAF